MLIYNFAKKFIGIDENDLKALGFSNLSQLRSEAADFADLFVRTPGYVHNFQHVHWIDFVFCAESAEESKVIINVKSKSYMASLSISKAYLTDNPSSEAYFVSLNNLRALSAKESDSISSEISAKSAPVSAIDAEQHKEVIPNEPIIKDGFDVEDKVYPETVFAEESYTLLDVDIDFEEEEIVDSPVEFSDVEPEPVVIKESVPPVVSTRIVQSEYKKIDTKEDDDSYVFDPKVASDELGLPVDLIEEFIQDFIAQANEFKSEMYSSLEENDLGNVAILSHKLKGVAANLRVENALGAITTVNFSKDPDIIKTNLDVFYKIMRKLAGEPAIVEEVVKKEEKIPQTQEDDFVLEFKEETPVEDVQVPEKIEIPELDDNLNLATDIEVEETIEMQEPIDTKEVIEVSYSKELSANAIGLDMETYEELFVDYIKDSCNVSSHIHQALAENNFDKCSKEACILKGMSDSMQMKEFNSELECLISSSDKNEMTDAIQRIDNVIEQISK